MKKHSGFTLIEIMVVVVIIGILAAIAVPQYTQYVQRSRLVEASSLLSGLRVQLEQFYQDNRTYDNALAGLPVAAALPTGPTGAGTCGVSPPAANTTRFFVYSCSPNNAGQGYTLFAVGVATQPTTGFRFELNQLNQRVTRTTASGWTSAVLPANCWLMSKGSTGC